MSYLEDISMKYNIKVLEIDSIPTQYVIGNKYHLSWASNRGYVWVLKSIQGDVVVLETPKTKKVLLAKIKDLRETNKGTTANARKNNRGKMY
tara:strand:- start:1276 stop:1551 length:276 start_codon:yes stop_codon:yes gene_type:complete